MRIILNMVLWSLPRGLSAKVRELGNSLPSQYRVRLSELGFREGEIVQCLRWTPFGGPRIYQVGDSVFSLASDVATFVEIEDVR